MQQAPKQKKWARIELKKLETLPGPDYDFVGQSPVKVWEADREMIIYRAGPHATGKKGAPQLYVTPIGDQKIPVDLTIY